MHCFPYEGEVGPWAGKVVAGESVFPSLLVGSEPLVRGLAMEGLVVFKRQGEPSLTT